MLSKASGVKLHEARRGYTMHRKPMFIRKKVRSIVAGLQRESRDSLLQGLKYRRMMLRLCSLAEAGGR